VIYLLADPRTHQIRYVGKTNQKLSARVTAHMLDTTKCHRVHWLNELKALGLRPNVAILSQNFNGRTWQEEERFWIRKLREGGVNLTNNTLGGDGVSGVTGEAKERMLATWRGRKHSPETIEKLKIARAKRVTSEETRKKMSDARRGKKRAPFSAEHRKKLLPTKLPLYRFNLIAVLNRRVLKYLLLQVGNRLGVVQLFNGVNNDLGGFIPLLEQ